MKKCCILFFLLIALTVQLVHAEEQYTEISLNELKMSPKTYKNKNVAYSGEFTEVVTVMDTLMDQEGYSSRKHLCLDIGDYSIPAFIKKSDEMTKLVTELKKRQMLKVYGKVKQFRIKPNLERVSDYYIEVEKIEKIEKSRGQKKKGGKKN